MGRRLNAHVHLVDPETGDGQWFRPGEDVPQWATDSIPDVGWADDKSDEGDVVDVSEFHTGGGWYEIGGERYRGEAAARAALK